MNKTQILKTLLLKSGDELVLRTAIISDAQDFIDYANEVGGETDHLLFGAGEFNISLEREQQIINSINQNPTSLMILGLVGHEIIASAQLKCPERSRAKHNSDISLSVKKEYWGMGVGSAVMEELIKFAKDNPTIKMFRLELMQRMKKRLSCIKSLGLKKLEFVKTT